MMKFLGTFEEMLDRTLLVGDIHGDQKNISKLFEIAISQKCDRIHCLGDFGCFPNLPKYKEFLEITSRKSLENGIAVSFTDGNHENHEYLNSLEISEKVFVAPGIEWWYRGKMVGNILSMGCANSIDKNYRIQGRDWFPEEIISQKDFYKCSEKADFIFSHDCPYGIDFGFELDEMSVKNQKMLLEICEVVQPKILFHGHYHRFHESFLEMSYGKLEVIGLNCGDCLEEQIMIFQNGALEWI